MTTKRRVRATGEKLVKVTFDLPASVAAMEVALVGDFNNWSPTETKLKRKKDSAWKVTVPLQAGQAYRYRFLLDGRHWENDWSADLYTPNEFGTDDSVVVT
jgi:1,4-alpha-glucan branching enzyme